MSLKRMQKSWDREALKNLKKELKIIEDLKSSTDKFVTLQRGAVIKLDTFHIIMAVQIVRNGLPAMLKEVNKLITRRKRLLK